MTGASEQSRRYGELDEQDLTDEAEIPRTVDRAEVTQISVRSDSGRKLKHRNRRDAAARRRLPKVEVKRRRTWTRLSWRIEKHDHII
jgi:hypothetical protein